MIAFRRARFGPLLAGRASRSGDVGAVSASSSSSGWVVISISRPRRAPVVRAPGTSSKLATPVRPQPPRSGRQLIFDQSAVSPQDVRNPPSIAIDNRRRSMLKFFSSTKGSCPLKRIPSGPPADAFRAPEAGRRFESCRGTAGPNQDEAASFTGKSTQQSAWATDCEKQGASRASSPAALSAAGERGRRRTTRALGPGIGDVGPLPMGT